MKLSIIVPAYNVESYVESCLESCCQDKTQLGLDYEVIVVNDGSTDDTSRILKIVQERYPQIRIFEQKNQGLSVARNVGVALAKGEYVWFVDGDDRIAPDCLDGLIRVLDGSDAVQILAFKVQEGIYSPEGSAFPTEEILVGKDVLVSRKFSWQAPYTVYRRLFLVEHNLSFFPGIYHEDMEFTPRAYLCANRVISYPHRIYHHIYNPRSITRVVNPKRCFDLLKVAESLRDAALGVEERNVKVVWRSFVAINVVQAVVLASWIGNTSDRNMFLGELRQHQKLFFEMLKAKEIRYKIYAIFLISLGRLPFVLEMGSWCLSKLN